MRTHLLTQEAIAPLAASCPIRSSLDGLTSITRFDAHTDYTLATPVLHPYYILTLTSVARWPLPFVRCCRIDVMQSRLDESARLGGKATQDMAKLRMQVRLCYNTVIDTGPGMCEWECM